MNNNPFLKKSTLVKGIEFYPKSPSFPQRALKFPVQGGWRYLKGPASEFLEVFICYDNK